MEAKNTFPRFDAKGVKEHYENLQREHWVNVGRKQAVEWLDGDCPHAWINFHSDEKLPTRNRRHCPKCWQELTVELAKGD